MNKTTKTIVVISFLIFIGIMGVVLGSVTSQTVLAAAKDRYLELQTFSKVLNLVQQYYVEEVDTSKLIQGAIKGMLAELDPHTNYLPPDIFKEFENETSGEFGGIGVEISVQDEVLTIISPIEDTPAWEAGIKAGDKIVGINGESTKGMTLAEAAQRMKGKMGAVIKFEIWRDGFEKPREFAIKRGTVKIKSVKYTDMEDGFVYVRLTSFIEQTASDLDKTLKEHIKKNSKIKGMIIDLRNNPGGLLKQSTAIADMFLEQGVIVSTIGRNQKDKEIISAKKDGTYENFPIIVLVNEYSASASEILSGALQDNKRAIIMGTKSFGKGSVQSVVKLGDGSGLKLTVARYYTPSGKSIQAEGITPDVVLDTVDQGAYEKSIIKKKVKREADIEGHLMSEKEKQEKSIAEKDWWNKRGEKVDESKLSAREKLLKQDYQVYQAFNYLKVKSL